LETERRGTEPSIPGISGGYILNKHLAERTRFQNFNFFKRAKVTTEDMTIDIEVKNFLAPIGLKESVIGALFLVGIAILLQLTLFGPNLKHIPLARSELSRRQRLKEYTHNSKALHRDAYKKVRFPLVCTEHGMY
jgi:hypothetical protein